MIETTVIIPYYNHGRFLHSAVQSALAASKRSVEIVVVNDGAVEKHASKYLDALKLMSVDVSVVSKPNGGLSSARNAGLAVAKGEYIQFLDSDDLLAPGKIDRQIALLRARPDASVAICNYYLGQDEGETLAFTYDSIGRFSLSESDFLFKWERGFSVPIHCGLFSRKVLQDVRFNENVKGKEDWIFWSELAVKHKVRFAYTPELGVVYRLHGGSMTRSLDIMGRNFHTAAEIIESELEGRWSSFKVESLKWLKEYYKLGPADLTHEQKAAKKPSTISPQHQADSYAPHLHLSSPNTSADRPLISVLIPVFNHINYLAECIQSVANQTASTPFEVLVLNDGSTEPGILELLLKEIDRCSNYRVYSIERNGGISASQNFLASQANGEFIAFLDCDDALSRDAIQVVSEHISRGNEDYFFSDRLDIDENSKVLRRALYGGYDWISPSENIKNDLLLGMVASHLKVIRRRSYLQIGGSDPSYDGVQDWALALKMSQDYKFKYINFALYRHRIHQNSVTTSARVSQFYLTNKLRRLYSQPPSCGDNITPYLVTRVHSLADTKSWRTINSYRAMNFDSSGRTLQHNELNVLREFNSFFSQINVSKSDALKLMGYLWSDNVIQTS